MAQKINPNGTEQLDFVHKGRECQVLAFRKSGGWTWNAMIKGIPLKGEDGTLASAQLALADGRAAVEDYIDAK